MQFKTIFFLFAISIVSAQAESNVYGFGSNEPQKVTSTTSSLNTMSAMRQKIREQDERIDGLTTIIEGLSASLHEFQMKKGTSAAVSTSQNDDALLQKLAKMIDEINANYVSKRELDKALGKKTKSTTTSKNKPKENVSNKSNATLYSEGVRHFVKQRYDEAKKRFTLTDSKNYKPAASNYYLGEISYYTKQYEDAIFYFKKSAGLYDKASYMDVLLLHTAISLDKTGNKSQAKVFYENIIENYKGKKTAKMAEDRLKKL